MIALPIDAAIPEALDALRAQRQARALVLVAPPGAGKTTRVPPAVLGAGLLSAEHPNLVMLQPRRVAARAAAQRIADEQGWQLGREVGYHVRFERRIARDTRLRVLTEGILTRQLLDDAILDGVGCVILDEFHERNIHTDLAIAMLREVQQTVRPDLVLIVMSATLEAEPVAKFLGDASSACPIVRSEGRLFPIETIHLQPGAGYLDEQVADAIARAVAGDLRDESIGGDVLVFLPGAEEIRRTAGAIAALARDEDLLVVPLHGSLPFDEQIRALRPAGKRKIILATNIAETSLTIEGVRTVIDSGRARVAAFDAERGLDRLEMRWISKASSAQRAGRAGRTAPGRCIRLWSSRHQQGLAEFDVPEVKRVDLASTVLSLHAWGANDPRDFGWYESPEEAALLAAERLLESLGAIAREGAGSTPARRSAITPLGKRIMQVPAHPRLARLLIDAAEHGIASEGSTIAALLSEKDILLPDRSLHFSQRGPATIGASDLLVRMQLFENAEREGFRFPRDSAIDMNATRQVARARDHFLRLIENPAFVSPPRSRGASGGAPGEPGGETDAGEDADDNLLLRLPLLAYPDRVARRRASNPSSALMVGGVGLKLAAESVVRQAEFFLALDVRHDSRSQSHEALVRIASAIEVEWLEALFPQSITRTKSATLDEARGTVVGRPSVKYLDLTIRESDDAAVDAQTAERVLASALTAERLRGLLLKDEDAARWIHRVNLLRKALPNHDWPAPLSDDFLAQVAERAVVGTRSIDAVKRALPEALRSMLHYPLERVLDVEAPESIEVPTGNRIKLNYVAQSDQPGEIAAPVLAVRLQEMFGQLDTPRIAQGRVAVLLHLLGPNYRAVQVTNDLKSFWATTYFQVRKDLKARYPKHSWPEDPLTAPPQAKGSRRRP